MFLQSKAQRDALRRPERGFDLERDRPAGMLEAFSAAFDATSFLDLSISRGENLRRFMLPALERIAEVSGDDAFRPRDEQGLARFTAEELERLYRDRTDYVEEIKAAHPDAGIKTYAEVQEEIRIEAERRLERLADVSRRASGASQVSLLAGSFGAVALDPINVLSYPLSAARGASLLARAMTEAGINVAAETAIQPFVYSYRNELGLDYSVADAMRNIGFAGAAGAGFVGGAAALKGAAGLLGEGIGRTYRRVAGEGRVRRSTALDAAADVVEQYDEIRAASPGGPNGVEPHLRALDQAQRDVMEGRVPALDNAAGRSRANIAEEKPPELVSAERELRQVREARELAEREVTDATAIVGRAEAEVRLAREAVTGAERRPGPGETFAAKIRGEGKIRADSALLADFDADTVATLRRKGLVAKKDNTTSNTLDEWTDILADEGIESGSDLVEALVEGRRLPSMAAEGRLGQAQTRLSEAELAVKEATEATGVLRTNERLRELAKREKQLEADVARMSEQRGQPLPGYTPSRVVDDPFARPVGADYGDMDALAEGIERGTADPNGRPLEQGETVDTALDAEFDRLEAERPADMVVATHFDEEGNPTRTVPVRQAIEEAEAEAGFFERMLDCMRS